MHRFLPALIKREGLKIAFVAVGHRARHAGRSNYGLWGRLKDGLSDLFGVMWLMRRCRLPGDVAEL
jgi:hypothetical protein